MLTAGGAGDVPVLTFDAAPSGAFPPVLCAGAAGDLARRPAGGDPMLVLRRRADVLRCLTDSTRFGMAGVTGSGELRGCPLTGAEMQSPDGGLLNMNPPLLREYRQRINGLFTHRAAEATRPVIEALAADLCRSLRKRRTVDAITGFAGPFTAGAVCWAMGIPREDWEQILKYSRVAFAVVPSAAAVSEVAAAWEDLYGYYEPIVAAKRARPDGSLTSRLVAVLDGLAASQIVHVIATVSNGFGAILPVLAVAVAHVAERPEIVGACRRGEQTWSWIAAHLLSHRALFPVALPRVALLDVRISGRRVPGGTVVLPSLIAAAHDPCGPPPLNIAFGAGPHFCPGAALTRVWLETALAAFFGSFPGARLLGGLEWQPGTLSFPREIRLALR